MKLAGDYQFTSKSFARRHSADFEQHVKPRYSGKPCTMLEIGVGEGMCAAWMCENVLTGKGRYIGIDPWEGQEETFNRAMSNVQPFGERVQLVRGHSRYILQHMPCWVDHERGRKELATVMPHFHRGMFDLVFIDGNHNAEPVKRDAELVLPLVSRGGWMIFADVRNRRPKKDHVADGVAEFLAANGEHVRLAWSGQYDDCYEVL